LLTARYNWARDELSIGQREIARLWSCTERTVKREMAKLRGLGWLVVKRQGARGRVTTYGLDTAAMLTATKAIWPEIGSDFVIRLEGAPSPSVVPFPVKGAVPAPDLADATEWGLARNILYQQDAGRYGAWLQALQRIGRAGGRLTLKAPSRFHAAYVQTHLTGAVLHACQTVDEAVTAVEIID
jgi:DNA-binding transcriptional MocR family regulator